MSDLSESVALISDAISSSDSDGYSGTLAEATFASGRKIANAITKDVCGSHDAAGGYVESLTEAVMGLTASMVKIADAIDRVASAIEDKP